MSSSAIPRSATGSTTLDLEVDDRRQLGAVERVELDDVVQAVDELAAEVLLRAPNPSPPARMFDVMISTAFLKSTVLPWPSVSRPSSMTEAGC